MQMKIYEIDSRLYCDLNRPVLMKHALTHLINIPDDAQLTIIKGKPVIVLPATSPHSPRITLTLEIAIFAARKNTIVNLYHVKTSDEPPTEYTTSA